MPRYKSFDDVLDDDNTGDFDLPEDKELDERTFRDDEEEDEDEDDRYDDRYDSVDESLEWHDYDPDC
jgi:hypothetical protein